MSIIDYAINKKMFGGGQAGTGGINPSGTKTIIENGTHDVKDYAKARVKVPIPDGYIKPSGTKTITENGTHNVSNYAEARVDIAPVIKVDELPTEDIDIEAVYICGEAMYVYTDEWVFNETLSPLPDTNKHTISFNTKNELGESVGVIEIYRRKEDAHISGSYPASDRLCYIYGYESYGLPKYYIVYDHINNTWYRENYRTVTLTSPIEDEVVLAWLEENATYYKWRKYTREL